MRWPVTTRIAAFATILMVVAGCDKAKGFIDGDKPAPPEVSPGEALDLAARPHILFQVFGEKEDPRMIPLAALEDGRLTPIALSADGWRQFDAMYLRKGKTYPLYEDGRQRGTVTVQQGMWEKAGAPLYTLPGCQALTPLAAVQIGGKVKASFTVELLASSEPLTQATGGKSIPDREAASIVKQISQREGAKAGIEPKMLESLDFRAVAISTGAGDAPTIVASFIDPAGANASASGAQTTHLFVVADRDAADGYAASFAHSVNGPVAGAEYRRYYDHLDLTGDGIDEIVLEAWRAGEETFLMVLGYLNGRWQEVYRGRANWCLDERRKE